MKAPFVRSPYNYDVAKASDESGLCCKDVSLAKQSFAEEVDINTIVRRFGLDGELPVGVRMPTYGDFSGVDDFQTAMHAVMDAKASFERMPAKVRARFDNDPARFVDFCSDDRNAEEVARMGLVTPEVYERQQRLDEAAELERARALVASRVELPAKPEAPSQPAAKPASGTGST